MTMLRLLDARARMTARELAIELEVSERTVLRDVEALNEAGFHVVSHRGAHGGFELLRGGGIAAPLTGVAPLGGLGDLRGRVVVRISPHGRQLAALTGRPSGLRVRRRRTVGHEREGWIVAEAPMQSPQEVLHDILALGPNVEVMSPAALRTLVRDAASAIEELYR